MTFRELRNNAVFWLSFGGCFYLLAHELGSGLLVAGCGALMLAVGAVVLVALVTDRFTD